MSVSCFWQYPTDETLCRLDTALGWEPGAAHRLLTGSDRWLDAAERDAIALVACHGPDHRFLATGQGRRA